MSVYEEDYTVELGLGGRYNDILIDESFVQGAWSFDQINSDECREIIDAVYNLAYAGTGFTKRQSAGLPGGGLAIELNGNGYLWRANVDAFSLVGGSMDIVVRIKTTHNSSTERAIAQKQATNSSGNGWKVSLQNGCIRFYLKNAAGIIFNFTSSVIADGEWHTIHCCYEPEQSRARIFKGATVIGSVTGVTTEPELVSAQFRVGMFADGVAGDGSGFIGSISKVMLGREGNPTLGAALEAAETWTDVTEDVDLGALSLDFSRGIKGTKITDLLASPGQWKFALDNSIRNSAGLRGYYTIGHANCREGFATGIPVRLTVNGVAQFTGWIQDAPADAGEERGQFTTVSASDWMQVAFSEHSNELDAQVDETADTVFGAAVEGASTPPHALELNSSVVIFPWAIDSSNGDDDFIASELQRVVKSSGSYGYPLGDGTLVYEPRELRQAGRAVAFSFSGINAPDDVVPEMSRSRIINKVQLTGYPRRLHASATEVIAALPVTDVAQPIPIDAVVILQTETKDPDNTAVKVGAAEVVSLATTDYTFNSAADGSGTNLTGSVTVSVRAFANVVRWTITNNSGSVAYITKLQARGRAVYHDQPVTVEVPEGSSESIRKNGLRTLKIDCPYEGRIQALSEYGRLIEAIYAEQSGHVPVTIVVNPHRSQALMDACVSLEVGDLITVEDIQTAITTDTSWFIQEKLLTIDKDRLMTFSFTLAPSWPESLVVNYSGAATGLHNMTFGGPLELSTPGDYVFTFNRHGDSVIVRGVAGGGGGGGGQADSTNHSGGGGGQGGAAQTAGITVSLTTTGYTGKVGVGGPAGGSGSNGTAGGTTEFRIPSSTIYLQLPGGNGGSRALGAVGGAGGTGAGAGTGAGNVAGTAGGNGGSLNNHGSNATNNANGAAGGGGGADRLMQGGAGGNGKDQSGSPGGADGFDPGGVGGRGGGVSMASGFRGAGGGGGSGSESSPGDATAGVGGALTLEIAA